MGFFNVIRRHSESFLKIQYPKEWEMSLALLKICMWFLILKSTTLFLLKQPPYFAKQEIWPAHLGIQFVLGI